MGKPDEKPDDTQEEQAIRPDNHHASAQNLADAEWHREAEKTGYDPSLYYDY